MTDTTPTERHEPPDWLNLDAIASAEDRREIAAVTEELRKLATRALGLRNRIERVCNLVEVAADIDDFPEYIGDLIGTTEVRDLCWLIGFWLAPYDTITTEMAGKLVEKYADVLGVDD